MRPVSRFRTLAGLVIILWLVELLNALLGHRLNAFGLVPRDLAGLPGIFLAPLLHAGFSHAASNTAGLLALGGLVALRGERHFVVTTLAIVLVSGGLVWLLGRNALHVGASGLVFGYFGLLVGRAWYRRTTDSVLVAAGVMVVYGGLLWGVLPVRSYISWEGHLAGLVAGILVARWRAGSETPVRHSG